MSRDYLALGFGAALGLVVLLAAAGAVVGLTFPKWNAEGLLETPGVLMPTADREPLRSVDQDSRLKTQYVTLAEFRKMEAAYSSQAALREYLAAAGQAESPVGQRLIAQSDSQRFWNAVAAPVLPFNRRDAKEFGELKDVASDSLLGIELRTDAKTSDLARSMLGVMSRYYTNALLRERIRTWILKNSGEAPARQKALRAEIVDAKMRIEATAIRIRDFKSLLARYPESTKLDARQVVSIADGSDRFLSPLAQLVAAETSVTQLREGITRKERQAQQLDLLERYFAQANQRFETALLASELVPALGKIAAQRFEGIDTESEWAREVVLRLEAEIAGYSSALSSFGIRNDYRVGEAANRDPWRLAAFGAAAGFLLLGMIAFLRAVMRAPPDGADAPATLA